MSGRQLAAVAAAVVASLLLCAAGVGSLFGGGAAACTTTDPTGGGTGPSVTPGPGGRWPAIGRWSPEQVGHAATIVTVGARMGVPHRGWVIAVATAMQESGLRNLPGGDRDSVGLFQQRPSQGWGTPTQLQDPVYAAGKFYQRLLQVPGWQTMPLTDAAQAVQRSAYPDAYAKWEPDAGHLVTAVGSVNSAATLEYLEQCLSSCPDSLSSGDTSGLARGCMSGAAVLARASTWLTAWNGGPVPYLSSGDPATWFGGYRRDCSGYASMALGLAGPGLNTAGLAAHSTPILKADLRPGDLLINPAPNGAGHVVIFDHWTNASMTSYVGYEQSGDGGTHHRVIPYPYFGGYPMSPFRYGTP